MYFPLGSAFRLEILWHFLARPFGMFLFEVQGAGRSAVAGGTAWRMWGGCLKMGMPPLHLSAIGLDL